MQACSGIRGTLAVEHSTELRDAIEAELLNQDLQLNWWIALRNDIGRYWTWESYVNNGKLVVHYILS